jgi:hypothetical protein
MCKKYKANTQITTGKTLTIKTHENTNKSDKNKA